MTRDAVSIPLLKALKVKELLEKDKDCIIGCDSNVHNVISGSCDTNGNDYLPDLRLEKELNICN